MRDVIAIVVAFNVSRNDYASRDVRYCSLNLIDNTDLTQVITFAFGCLYFDFYHKDK